VARCIAKERSMPRHQGQIKNQHWIVGLRLVDESFVNHYRSSLAPQRFGIERYIRAPAKALWGSESPPLVLSELWKFATHIHIHLFKVRSILTYIALNVLHTSGFQSSPVFTLMLVADPFRSQSRISDGYAIFGGAPCGC
jgi:hypothetical protein